MYRKKKMGSRKLVGPRGERLIPVKLAGCPVCGCPFFSLENGKMVCINTKEHSKPN